MCVSAALWADMWLGRARFGHLPAGELQDDCPHAQPGQLHHHQHTGGQRHHHHLRVLPGVHGGSEGEPLPPADGATLSATSSRLTHTLT